jgi:hypothetical protein
MKKLLFLVLFSVCWVSCQTTPKEDTIKVPTLEWEYSNLNPTCQSSEFYYNLKLQTL